MWKSAPELIAVVKDLPQKEALADLWALHYFCEYGVFSPDYKTNDVWADIIVISPKGEELIQSAQESLASFSRPVICLATFGLFYYHDLLIDHHRTDINRVLEILNRESCSGSIKWPCMFGRLLYDRFNDTVESDRTDHLDPEEVVELLRDTPKGVYQVGRFLSGPLGIIESAETRYVPPTNELPLWHCSDTGCGFLHRVELTPPPIPQVQAYSRLKNAAKDTLGNRAKWKFPLNKLFLESSGIDRHDCYDLPLLIANAIIGSERAALLAFALRSPVAGQLRHVMTRAGIVTSGTPEAIAERLDEAHQLQILLALTDRELRDLLDASVIGKRIDIPFNEIRTAGVKAPQLSNRDRKCELSSLGLRSRPKVALAALHSIIWELYVKLGLLEELGWKLRRKPGVPPHGALMDFIRASHPDQVMSHLVLTSMPVTRAVCDLFGIPLEDSNRTAGLSELLLWKFGFNPTRFPDQYTRFRTRLDEFNATLLPLVEVRSEEDREKVRAVGVNLFVSVEHFLQELISYNIWLLASDHFVTTRFKYSIDRALAAVPAVLGRTLTSGDLDLAWHEDGDNTLGTLLVYAQGMINWMNGLKNIDRATLLRPETDLPHYADESEQSFVFRHTKLWADADPGELEQYIHGLVGIVVQLHRAELATVRNGLDHRRDDCDFPRADLMLACAARLRDALEVADARRYLPKSFWLQSSERDRFGRQQFSFLDYRGMDVKLGGPPVVSGLPKPEFSHPVLIAPGNLLGEPNAELRFDIRERSAYSDYWANFPRRRKIPSPHRAPTADESLDERAE